MSNTSPYSQDRLSEQRKHHIQNFLDEYGTYLEHALEWIPPQHSVLLKAEVEALKNENRELLKQLKEALTTIKQTLETKEGIQTPAGYIKAACKFESAKLPCETISKLENRMLHGAIGLCTESGELLDTFKKLLFYGKPLDLVNVVEELGDIFWYLGIIADALGTSFPEIWKRNIEKLSKRYPGKFTQEAALNRNLKAERTILEAGSAIGSQGVVLPATTPTKTVYSGHDDVTPRPLESERSKPASERFVFGQRVKSTFAGITIYSKVVSFDKQHTKCYTGNRDAVPDIFFMFVALKDYPESLTATNSMFWEAA